MCAHSRGNRPCNMIAQLVATMALEGGYQELQRIGHPHPTVSEAVLDAARAGGRWAIPAYDAAARAGGRRGSPRLGGGGGGGGRHGGLPVMISAPSPQRGSRRSYFYFDLAS